MKKNLETASPYEGMSENDISNTSLGSPSANIRHNNECIGGEQYQAIRIYTRRIVVWKNHFLR